LRGHAKVLVIGEQILQAGIGVNAARGSGLQLRTGSCLLRSGRLGFGSGRLGRSRLRRLLCRLLFGLGRGLVWRILLRDGSGRLGGSLLRGLLRDE
jgi:hypothetical protein